MKIYLKIFWQKIICDDPQIKLIIKNDYLWKPKSYSNENEIYRSLDEGFIKNIQIWS